MTEPLRPPPVVIVREFPRFMPETVFEAFSTAEHIKAWFSPESFTTPEAVVDFRAGGAFEVCMRAPDGQEHWSRGRFDEVAPPEKIVFSGSVDGGFSARTTLTFERMGPGGTRLTVHQAYEVHDPVMLAAIKGAPEGWRTTLDKLEREVERIAEAKRREGETRPAEHGTFVIERRYKASLAQLWTAWTEIEAKARWFAAPSPDWTLLERTQDARPGGRERLAGRWLSGQVTEFDAVYHDVIPERRLVYSYEMRLDGRKISVSLATIEFSAETGGSRLRVTEQGAFLDGYEDKGARERGTGILLDQLGKALDG